MPVKLGSRRSTLARSSQPCLRQGGPPLSKLALPSPEFSDLHADLVKLGEKVQSLERELQALRHCAAHNGDPGNRPGYTLVLRKEEAPLQFVTDLPEKALALLDLGVGLYSFGLHPIDHP